MVEHRLPEDADDARQMTSGYVKVSTVRRLAEKAGFQLAGSSEINANPRDTTDHPEGVWTLPPTYRLGDKDRAAAQSTQRSGVDADLRVAEEADHLGAHDQSGRARYRRQQPEC